MKLALTLCVFFSVIAGASGQGLQEENVKTTIKNVTIYLKGAQVNRTGSVAVPSGESKLHIEGLSPFLDPNSIQVNLSGDVTILAVNHAIDFLTEEKETALEHILEGLKDSLSMINGHKEILAEETEILKANKTIGGTDNGYALADLKAISQYYVSRLEYIKFKTLAFEKEAKKLSEKIRQHQRQLSQLRSEEGINKSNVTVTVSAENPVSSTLSLSYVTEGAGWLPTYDVRVKDVESPLMLTLKAKVRQYTGEDWNNVKLRFSNVDPSKSGSMPALSPYYLRFNQRYARPTPRSYADANVHSVRGKVTALDGGGVLPGVNIIATGTTVGTISDINGSYSLEIPSGTKTLTFSFIGYKSQQVPVSSAVINVVMQPAVQRLEEVVVMGYGSVEQELMGKVAGVKAAASSSVANQPEVTVLQNQTNFEIEVEKPYTILSDKKTATVDLITYEIPAGYLYKSTPKLDDDAFLQAEIVDWDQYQLLEGEANIYFEKTFVGKTLLDVRYVTDTLNISLGRDRGVIVQREKEQTYNKNQFLGGNRVETRTYKLTVKNAKDNPVAFLLKDQVPVSTNNEIEVEILELSGGQLHKNSGLVKWPFTLQPGEQKEVILRYEVKFPKDRRLVVE